MRVPAHNAKASMLTLNLSFGILAPRCDGPNCILHYSWQPSALISLANCALRAQRGKPGNNFIHLHLIDTWHSHAPQPRCAAFEKIKTCRLKMPCLKTVRPFRRKRPIIKSTDVRKVITCITMLCLILMAGWKDLSLYSKCIHGAANFVKVSDCVKSKWQIHTSDVCVQTDAVLCVILLNCPWRHQDEQSCTCSCWTVLGCNLTKTNTKQEPTSLEKWTWKQLLGVYFPFVQAINNRLYSGEHLGHLDVM